MALKYVRGDLFGCKEDIIAHGVNCRGGFGSGVAGTIAQKYPKARSYYRVKFEHEGWDLGEAQFVSCPGKIIANCATQDEYLPRGACHADYDSIEIAMLKVKAYARKFNLSIAIPKIGAGLAGGNWNIIEGVLGRVFDDYDVTIYYLE